MRKEITGLTILQLLREPSHSVAIRDIFVELARAYRSPLENPLTSWSVITGKNEELQHAISWMQNIAFSQLTMADVKELTRWAIQKVSFRRERRRPRLEAGLS